MLDGNSNESLNDRGKFCTVVTRDEFPSPHTVNRSLNKCKKLQFIHKLTASDTSKTAKITKR